VAPTLRIKMASRPEKKNRAVHAICNFHNFVSDFSNSNERDTRAVNCPLPHVRYFKDGDLPLD
jgi:hypothetical protein